MIACEGVQGDMNIIVLRNVVVWGHFEFVEDKGVVGVWAVVRWIIPWRDMDRWISVKVFSVDDHHHCCCYLKVLCFSLFEMFVDGNEGALWGKYKPACLTMVR
ncbi:hypothetical protein HanRHA438_Chr03g0132721 [Helianthus annuus]|nr:hypothetical protein HanRHA438_Chr03g0132721 [Helianthus annuus]